MFAIGLRINDRGEVQLLALILSYIKIDLMLSEES